MGPQLTVLIIVFTIASLTVHVHTFNDTKIKTSHTCTGTGTGTCMGTCMGTCTCTGTVVHNYQNQTYFSAYKFLNFSNLAQCLSYFFKSDTTLDSIRLSPSSSGLH